MPEKTRPHKFIQEQYHQKCVRCGAKWAKEYDFGCREEDPWKGWHLVWGGNAALGQCPECWCMVYHKDREAHYMWHRSLDARLGVIAESARDWMRTY